MSGPIRTHDSPEDRIAKLLPADVTAAFLSAKAGLVAALGEPNGDNLIFWTFIAILLICPFYFWFVTKAKNALQIGFLCLSFVVYANSIANTQFVAFLVQYPALTKIGPFLQSGSIVLPILWAFLISRIFIEAVGQRVITPGKARE
jgi:hypothetical protein